LTLPKPLADKSTTTAPGELDSDVSILFSAPVFRSVVEIDDYAAPGSLIADQGDAQRHVVGQVYVEFGKTNLTRLKDSLVNHNSMIALVGLLISALLGWRFGRGITRPILAMADAVSKIAGGHLEQRVTETSDGELRTLEQGFNIMATQLELSRHSMQERIDDATQQLRYQANHDALTGLVNRREFEQRLERALKSAQELDLQHVFCYMDLDQFKIVNDTCGHGAGDELLRQLSQMLSRRTRERDTLARLGGDEFGLLLENCSLEVARNIAEELRAMVHEFRFMHDDKVFSIGASIGLVAITQATESVVSIMSNADRACFAAKDAGRNQVHVYEPTSREIMQRHGEMQWISRITSALETDRFRLYAQPIRPLAAAKGYCHFEVLLRKIGEDGQIVLPMAFIPAAERFQFMKSIDRWVIRHTFAAYSSLCSQDADKQHCMLTINLSGISLGDKTLLDYIIEQFALYDVPPQCIGFEITETAAITNLAHTIELMSELKAIGCRFLLDDFGSGMSSFGYLKNLPVDYIKIDGSFVQHMDTNPIDFAMVQSIHDIAQAMQISTIAEFVESPAILEKLESIGVHYGQGNYLGMPVPIEQLTGLQAGKA
jgi:diguanylate cyclase (GGDEF)-like protein